MTKIIMQQLILFLKKLRFLARHMDAESATILESNPPPIDLMSVSIFRVSILKYKKKAGI